MPPDPPTPRDPRHEANYIVRTGQVMIDLLVEILAEIRSIREENKR